MHSLFTRVFFAFSVDPFATFYTCNFRATIQAKLKKKKLILFMFLSYRFVICFRDMTAFVLFYINVFSLFEYFAHRMHHSRQQTGARAKMMMVMEKFMINAEFRSSSKWCVLHGGFVCHTECRTKTTERIKKNHFIIFPPGCIDCTGTRRDRL